MSETSVFERFDAAAPQKSRLFFALYPEPQAAERAGVMARRLRHDHGLTGKPLRDDRFHVTLQWFGDFPDLPRGLVGEIVTAAARVSAPVFDVTFDRVASFKRKRSFNQPLVLLGDEGLSDLKAFYLRLGQALASVGFGHDPNPRFNPHVTLLYDDRRVVEQPIEPLRWTVREFVLVQSLLGQTQHVALGRWPLQG
jgi:2'-5' RNA ligase